MLSDYRATPGLGAAAESFLEFRASMPRNTGVACRRPKP